MTVQFGEREFEVGGKVGVSRPNPMVYEEVPNSADVTFDINNNDRVGINILSSASVLVGQKIKKMVVILRRTNTEADGQILARVRDSADVIKATSENSIQAHDVAIVDPGYPFTFVFTNPVEIASGDNILIETAAVAAIRPALSSPGNFDGSQTRRQRRSGGVYSPAISIDMTGQLLTR